MAHYWHLSSTGLEELESQILEKREEKQNKMEYKIDSLTFKFPDEYSVIKYDDESKSLKMFQDKKLLATEHLPSPLPMRINGLYMYWQNVV